MLSPCRSQSRACFARCSPGSLGFALCLLFCFPSESDERAGGPRFWVGRDAFLKLVKMRRRKKSKEDQGKKGGRGATHTLRPSTQGREPRVNGLAGVLARRHRQELQRERKRELGNRAVHTLGQ